MAKQIKKPLKKADPQISKLIKLEEARQQNQLEMIPSENYASQAVMTAVGSVLANKYSEGYAGKRYYQGNDYVDEVERLAISRVQEMFRVPFANVQPYSGSPANTAVYFALLQPGDTIMGLELGSGGHLTHGHPKVTFSGSYFKSVQYTVEKDGFIDYAKLENLALKHKPKIIVSGTTAYPRTLNFKKFGEIADKVGAWHLSDISHIAGLVVTGVHPSPVAYADVVMFTTHKTLRGPRGAVLLVTKKGLKKDPELGAKINKAIIPGLQGGPHNNTTAGIAVALKEAQSTAFAKYSRQVVTNSKVLAREFKKYGFNMMSGGTDNHLILINLANKGIDGWSAAWALEYAGIILNRNSIPNDPLPPFYTSGIRLGTPAITTRGMKEKEMVRIAGWINEVVNIAVSLLPDDGYIGDKVDAKSARDSFKKAARSNKRIREIAGEVKKLCTRFPVP